MSDTNVGQPQVINPEFAKPVDKGDIEKAKIVREISSSKDDKLSMEVKVSSPFTNYFSGQAFSLSATNATGPFDILPRHHNFISLLEACTLVIRTVNGDEQKIEIAGGLIHVKADRTTVFLDI